MKSKKYIDNGMNEELYKIINNFDNSGTDLAAGNRNLIKFFDYQGQSIAIKSFKTPIFINGFIYKFFRKSKAKRSFENANFLISKNIGTPKPIAYFEESEGLFLKKSYYICENLDYDFMFRVIFDNQQSINLEKLLKSIANFSFKMHEAGIEFLDHSPGNTLIKVDENGNYNCYLVDLNRMKFHDSMSTELRMKNLNKLTPNDYMVSVIANEYAKLSGLTQENVYQSLILEVHKFYYNFDKKQNFKRKLHFWKK